MKIAPIPTLDDAVNQVRSMTADVVAHEIIPNEHFLKQHDRRAAEEWTRIAQRVKQMGLWAPHLPEEYGGLSTEIALMIYFGFFR